MSPYYKHSQRGAASSGSIPDKMRDDGDLKVSSDSPLHSIESYLEQAVRTCGVLSIPGDGICSLSGTTVFRKSRENVRLWR